MANAVTYTREMREYAKAQGKHLITISVPGFEIQAPVSPETKDAVSQFMSNLIKSRPGPPPDFEAQADELWSALDVLCDLVAEMDRQLNKGLLDMTSSQIQAHLQTARDVLERNSQAKPRTKNEEPAAHAARSSSSPVPDPVHPATSGQEPSATGHPPL